MRKSKNDFPRPFFFGERLPGKMAVLTACVGPVIEYFRQVLEEFGSKNRSLPQLNINKHR